MYIPTVGDCIVGDWDCICAQNKHKIRQKQIKSDIFVWYLSQCYQPNNEKKANAAVWIYHVWFNACTCIYV